MIGLVAIAVVAVCLLLLLAGNKTSKKANSRTEAVERELEEKEFRERNFHPTARHAHMDDWGQVQHICYIDQEKKELAFLTGFPRYQVTYPNCGGIRSCEIVKTYAGTGSTTGSIDLVLNLDDVRQPIFKLCLISGVTTNTMTAKYRNAEEFAQKVKSSIENLKA